MITAYETDEPTEQPIPIASPRVVDALRIAMHEVLRNGDAEAVYDLGILALRCKVEGDAAPKAAE